MATVQQSIQIKVPVHTAYNQLTQFEAYPRFMEDVEEVQQIDDSHLRWKTRLADSVMEWDAEITEQEPDRCIAWHNISDPAMAGRVEVQQAGADASRVTITLQSQPEPKPAPGSSAASGAEEMEQRLQQSLVRMKDFLEAFGETGGWRGEIQDAQVIARDGEPWPEDAPSSPDAAAMRRAAEFRGDPANPVPEHHSFSQADVASMGTKPHRLSPATEEDPWPPELDEPALSESQLSGSSGDSANPSEAMTQSMKQPMEPNEQDAEREAKLKKAIERSVPPSA